MVKSTWHCKALVIIFSSYKRSPWTANLVEPLPSSLPLWGLWVSQNTTGIEIPLKLCEVRIEQYRFTLRITIPLISQEKWAWKTSELWKIQWWSCLPSCSSTRSSSSSSLPSSNISWYFFIIHLHKYHKVNFWLAVEMASLWWWLKELLKKHPLAGSLFPLRWNILAWPC